MAELILVINCFMCNEMAQSILLKSIRDKVALKNFDEVTI